MAITRGRYTEEDLRARLRFFEEEYGRNSEEFITEWEAGRLPHTADHFVWAGLCYRLGVREREFA
jgi:hypothetical protein